MTYERRSTYEYGDPARDEAADHARADARGRRLDEMAEAIVSGLSAGGILLQPGTAKTIVFGILADCLYGTQAIDIPTNLRGDICDPL